MSGHDVVELAFLGADHHLVERGSGLGPLVCRRVVVHELGDGRPAACLDVAQDFVALAVNAELLATGVRGLTQVDGRSVGGLRRLRGLLKRGAYLASSGALTDQRISSRRLRLRQPPGVRTMLWW